MMKHGQLAAFPATRYAGSKRKLLGILEQVFAELDFRTAADPFCGTGAVSYLLKTMGKDVVASDYMECNAVCARALVENSRILLGERLEEIIAGTAESKGAPGFVETTFAGVFFEDEENRFIDGILPGIHSLRGYEKDLALFTLFQACLAKRPYNLFHRANLYMRKREVKRSFGNKKTWDTPFPVHMSAARDEADGAVFDNGTTCRALHLPIERAPIEEADLVYLDPPYVSARGSSVDYLDHYHFLEGLCRPQSWPGSILHRYKHKPLRGKGESPWSRPGEITGAFEETLSRCSRAKVVVSYRSDGIPSVEDLRRMLKRAGKEVRAVDAGGYVYALSKNRESRETILVGT